MYALRAAGAPAGWPDTNTIPPAVNSAPLCSALSLSTVSGGSASPAIACTDYDGDPLAYTVKTPPAHGSLVQSGSAVTYASTAGYVGADSFTLSASDGTTSTAIPTATRTALRAYAGRTISLAVAFTVTSSDGSQHTTTTTVQLAIALVLRAERAQETLDDPRPCPNSAR